MRTRSHIAMLFAAVAAFGSILSTPPADAALVRITFSGTYDISGPAIFGESGSAVPFSYELTYDTAFDTDPTHFAAGAALGSGRYAAHDMHAYSASGVTTTTFLFGTKAWDFHTDSIPTVFGAHPAPLWMDTDLSTSPPTRVCLHLGDTLSGLLAIGGVAGGSSSSVGFGPGSFMHQRAAVASSGDMIIASTIVPEPATFELGIVAAGAFLAFLWRRRRSR